MLRGSLEWLLAPMDLAVFLEQHFEKRCLVVRGDPRRYRGLPALADIDRAITHREIASPLVRMARDGAVISADAFTRKGGIVDPVLVAERIAEGATVIVDAVEKWSERVARLCRVLGRQILGSAWANMYLTPRRSRGFSPHTDDHDVFVLQLAGEKQWFLYEPPAALPPLTPVSRGQLEVGEPIETPTLRPGDLLYIPRGHAHAAAAQESDSLHLTIGLTPATWIGVVRAALDDFAERDERLRHAVPIGSTRAPSEETRAELAAMLRDFAAGVDAKHAFQLVHAALLRERRTLAPGHVAAAFDREPLSLDSRVALRPAHDLSIARAGSAIELSLPGRTLTVPAPARKAIRFMLAKKRFRVADLPGNLDDAGKLALVSRLVREGLLRVVRAAPRLA